ncbi:MAG: hypothetical protein ABSH25_10335 [Syntrophorhabdales bacterium]
MRHAIRRAATLSTANMGQPLSGSNNQGENEKRKSRRDAMVYQAGTSTVQGTVLEVDDSSLLVRIGRGRVRLDVSDILDCVITNDTDRNVVRRGDRVALAVAPGTADYFQI